jgi:putative endonuclease
MGRLGEDLAARFLQDRGHQILDRNVHTRFGELDLITRKTISGREHLIFVEVKTRSSTRFGYPEQAVSAGKITRMLKSAQLYLQRHPEWDGPFQLDVIAVLVQGDDQSPEIRHFENISL